MSTTTRDRLAERHLAMLQGYADGLTTEEVAEAMDRKVSTVWDLAMQARRTLGAATTTQAVALAISLGYIEVEHGQGPRLRRARDLVRQAAALLEV